MSRTDDWADDAITPGQAARPPGTLPEAADHDRSTRRRLDEEHQWLTLALAAGQMGLWEWNFTTGERRWNPTMYDLYGVDPARVTTLAPPHVEEILAEDAPGLQREIRRLRAEGGASQVEFRIRRRDDGRVRWISSRGVMRYDDGVERMLGVSYDITERKATERALLDADQRKDEFLAMLAHELRNPLAPLTNALRLLERGGRLDDSDRMALAMAGRQTRQLQRLVDDLLEVNRITRGRIELRLAPVDVPQAVRDAVASVLPALRQRDQRLHCELPESCAPIVADAARIAQVLENLLHNASKYTPAGGEIRVALQDFPGAVEIRVADDGIGIEPDAIGRIFDLFAQADATLDRTHGGLGIGLALVRRLVELHGGNVEAASPGKGQGATFTVRLPRRPHAS